MSWVSEAKKAKTQTDDLIVSTADELLVSLNDGLTWNNEVNVRDSANSSIANQIGDIKLTDCTGDGINLYSATIDPYSRSPLDLGWQIQKSVGSTPDSSVTRNANKSYYLLNVKFRSTTALNIFMSNSSYVKPSQTNMTQNQALFIKRTTEGLTTRYTDELGNIRSATTQIYNKSLYSMAEYDEANTDAQTMYSANFIAGAVRVALINNDLTGDYAAVQNNDYSQTQLRMIWAPNPSYNITRIYTENYDTYQFDILDRQSDPTSNKFYRIDHDTLSQIGTTHSFPTAMYKEVILPHTPENLNSQVVLATLTRTPGTDFYEASLQIVVWVEGSDNECVKAFTAGDGNGLDQEDSTSGAARISFCFSFYGEEIAP